MVPIIVDQPHGRLCDPGRVALSRATRRGRARPRSGSRSDCGNVAIPLAVGRCDHGRQLLLANLFSPIGVTRRLRRRRRPRRVGLSLIVMLTLIPAGRTIIDRRREARGKLKRTPRVVGTALPGIERGWLRDCSGSVRGAPPAPYFVAVVAVTVWFGVRGHAASSRSSASATSCPGRHRARTIMETLDDRRWAARRRLASCAGTGRGHRDPHTSEPGRPPGPPRSPTPSVRPAAVAGPMAPSYESISCATGPTTAASPNDKLRPGAGGTLHAKPPPACGSTRC